MYEMKPRNVNVNVNEWTYEMYTNECKRNVKHHLSWRNFSEGIQRRFSKGIYEEIPDKSL